MSNRCYRAYLTPPWWVTMGYAPRYDFQDQLPPAFQSLGTPPQTSADQPQPGTPPQTPSDQPPAGTPPQTSADQPPPGTPPQTSADQPPPGTPPQTPPGETPPVSGEKVFIEGTVAPQGAETTVDARRQADHTTVATTTTDDEGNFSLPIPINGTPFDGYLNLTKSGRVPTRVFVSRPLIGSIQGLTIRIGWVTLTDWQTLTSVYQTMGLQAQATQATVMVSVRDSINLAVVQADTVAFFQNGSQVGYVLDPSSLGAAGGLIFGLNVPPGVTEVVVTSRETSLGAVQITAAAGEITFVILFAGQT